MSRYYKANQSALKFSLYFFNQYGGTWKCGDFGQVGFVRAIEGAEITKPETTKPDLNGL